MLRVLVVEDEADMRHLLSVALGHDTEFEVVGLAKDGREAAALAAELRPDVVLLDTDLPDVSGLETVNLVRSAAPGARIVVFSAFEQDQRQMEASGAAFVRKDHGLGPLLSRLHDLADTG